MDKWDELKKMLNLSVGTLEECIEGGDKGSEQVLRDYKFILLSMESIEKREEKDVISKELKYSRFLKYQSRLREFLENFGIFSYSYDVFGVNLIYEGRFHEDYMLAENMGLKHYDTYDEDGEMFEILMTWEYLRAIRHLWENVFKFKVIR